MAVAREGSCSVASRKQTGPHKTPWIPFEVGPK